MKDLLTILCQFCAKVFKAPILRNMTLNAASAAPSTFPAALEILGFKKWGQLPQELSYEQLLKVGS